MQKGDSRELRVTTVKDSITKESLCQIKVGRYTIIEMSMEEALVLVESVNRVRELYLEQLRRRVTNATVTQAYTPYAGRG